MLLNLRQRRSHKAKCRPYDLGSVFPGYCGSNMQRTFGESVILIARQRKASSRTVEAHPEVTVLYPRDFSTLERNGACAGYRW